MQSSDSQHRNPIPTVDTIIEVGKAVQNGRAAPQIVLIERKNPPLGWALPGGFVDYGETLAAAARRESEEETGLVVELIELFHAYSDPTRDPRQHTVSTVFIARAHATPRGGDDAADARLFDLDQLPTPIVFDHAQIISDYAIYRESGQRPPPER